jgi:hypothetical protein
MELLFLLFSDFEHSVLWFHCCAAVNFHRLDMTKRWRLNSTDMRHFCLSELVEKSAYSGRRSVLVPHRPEEWHLHMMRKGFKRRTKIQKSRKSREENVRRAFGFGRSLSQWAKMLVVSGSSACRRRFILCPSRRTMGISSLIAFAFGRFRSWEFALHYFYLVISGWSYFLATPFFWSNRRNYHIRFGCVAVWWVWRCNPSN